MNLRGLIVGSLLAGVGMFMWGNVSWMVLKWHSARTLKGEDGLKAALVAGATEPGMYQLPGLVDAQGKERTMEECQAEMMKGPLMIAMIRPGADTRPMASYMVGGFVTQVVLALLLGLILAQVNMTYGKLVMFSGLIGLLGGAAAVAAELELVGLPSI